MRAQRSATLASRAEHLRRAVDVGEGRLNPDVLVHAKAVLDRTAERTARSAEHTVVALAGATGAGKSSVFNALVGGELARTSRQRPTTSLALAAVADSPELPGSSATDLLDWLGIPSRHDIAASQHTPSGLVLLDLPDHDSVVAEHRLRADYVTERADLLVWVTNPQKYADGILHERYLRPLAHHQGSVLLVLNQADRLSPAEAEACVADLGRLAALDGLKNVQVIATSAVTGAGIGELREIIAIAVRRREAATARLNDEVRSAARALLASLGPEREAGHRAAAERTRLIATLESAAGVDLVVEAVRGAAVRDAVAVTGWPPTRWVQRFRADPLRRLGLRPTALLRSRAKTASADRGSASPSDSAVELRRSSLPPASLAVKAEMASATRAYVAQAAAALPGEWGERVHIDAVAQAKGLNDALDVAVSSTALDASRPPRWWAWMGALQWVLLAALTAGLLWLATLAVVDYFRLPQFLTPVIEVGAFSVPWPTALVIAGGVLGVLAAAIARVCARVGANRRAKAASKRLRRSVETVARERLTGTVEAELAALETIADAATKAMAA